MPKIMPKISEEIWESYNQAKLKEEKVTDQTSQFFESITPAIKSAFVNSKKRVVHFGAGIGSYLAPLSKERDIIGYDYSRTAVAALKEAGIKAREVDLDKTISSQELAYQDFVKEDLSVSADILMIRTLEYLTPEAVKLLLLSLIDQAKPGSTFYIETSDSCNGENATLKAIGHQIDLPPRYIASFFAPRTDIQFLSHKLSRVDENGTEMDIEQLVMQKI